MRSARGNRFVIESRQGASHRQPSSSAFQHAFAGTNPAPDGTNAYLYTSLNLRFSDVFIAGGGATFSRDELRIGDTWAAVTPASPIPDPAGLLLLAVPACVCSHHHHPGRA
jgi:hypothetical protein